MTTENAQPRGHDTVLDVTGERLAAVYAKGFLQAAHAAEGQGGQPTREAVDELRAVQEEVILAYPQFAAAIRSAFLAHDERTALIDRVLGGRVSPLVVNTLKVLSAHDRLPLFPQVARQAAELHDRDNGRVHVRVTTAHPLSQELLDELAGALRAKLGVEPVLRPEVDEEMIAGLKVRVKDTVYDGSLKTVFAKAKNSIIEHAIERIENNPSSFLADEPGTGA